MSDKDQTVVVAHVGQLLEASTRRKFLKAMSVGGSAVFLTGVLAACSDDDDPPTGPGNGSVALNLSNETGILNYAYALEQLEAAFYTKVAANFGASGLSAAEQTIFGDIKNHEVIHRDALKALLGTAKIGDLAVSFEQAGVNFSNRASILGTAQAFEDLGVSAYNGAGRYLTGDNLTVAGKIVSVEARHAAVIRDILFPNSAAKGFAGDDVVDAQGLDVMRRPAQVLPIADPYIATTVTIGTPPTA